MKVEEPLGFKEEAGGEVLERGEVYRAEEELPAQLGTVAWRVAMGGSV